FRSRVLFEQRGTGRSGQAEKIGKFFGKHVILAHGEPRLGRYFFLVRAGLRQIPKIAIGEKTKLVVIVEDDPAPPGDAEVFGQQIARKNVRHGQILDGLAVIASGGCTLSRIGFGEENVKRTNATLDVSMSDDDIVAFQPHRISGSAEQIFQEGGLESVPWDAEVLELVSFHSTSGAIVLEDQLVTAHHLVWSGILRRIESILDHLENDVVAGQSEDEHDHSARAFGRFETVGRGVQLRDEIAIKLRFGMSVKTDFVVKIG